MDNRLLCWFFPRFLTLKYLFEIVWILSKSIFYKIARSNNFQEISNLLSLTSQMFSKSLLFLPHINEQNSIGGNNITKCKCVWSRWLQNRTYKPVLTVWDRQYVLERERKALCRLKSRESYLKGVGLRSHLEAWLEYG